MRIAEKHVSRQAAKNEYSKGASYKGVAAAAGAEAEETAPLFFEEREYTKALGQLAKRTAIEYATRIIAEYS